MGRKAKNISRKQFVDALTALSTELGRTPQKLEFQARTGMKQRLMEKHFESWNDALAAAGLPPNVVRGGGANELLDDWGNVTRDLGRCPYRADYRARGKFGLYTFTRLFGSWPGVGRAFYVRSAEDPLWQDVIALIREREERGRDPSLMSLEAERQKVLFSPPTTIAYGEPLNCAFLRNAPVNEAGVVYLFGCLASKMGYSVEAIQTAFPDCEAKRKDPDGKLRRVRIEFEFESKNFLLHKHDPADCDVIVCWRDNWPECPLQVVELSKELGAMNRAAA